MRFPTWVGDIIEWCIYRLLGLMHLITTFLPPGRSLSFAPSTFRPTIFLEVFFLLTVETFHFFSLFWVWTFITLREFGLHSHPRCFVITSPALLPILFKQDSHQFDDILGSAYCCLIQIIQKCIDPGSGAMSGTKYFFQKFGGLCTTCIHIISHCRVVVKSIFLFVYFI